MSVEYFRRINLDTASPRRGILGQGSFLTVSSIATRTSPVIRGKWVLENLLGSPPPIPPPGVEINLDDAEAVKVTTLRQRLEKHRANPVCASCHRMMDPIGLALENFRPGRYLAGADGKLAIDASGELVDGTPLHGVTDVRSAVLSRSDVFVTTVTEKLLTYALGRTVQPYDMPTVRAIVRRCRPERLQFFFTCLGVIESAPFRMKMKQPEENPRRLTMAFITKKHLSRRTFLQGGGVTWRCRSWIPWFRRRRRWRRPRRARSAFREHLFSARRHDVQLDAREGRNGLRVLEILKPLEPFRDRVNVISDLSHPAAYGGGSATANHNRSAAAFLTGAHARRGTQALCGISWIKLAAQKIGQDTPLPSIEMTIEDSTLSCATA